MIKKNIFFLIISLFGLNYLTQAQISEGGRPHSFSEYYLKVVEPQSRLQTLVLPALDSTQGNKKSSITNMSFLGIAVDMGLNNSGEWLALPNGDRIWKLKIKSVGAKMNKMYNCLV